MKRNRGAAKTGMLPAVLAILGLFCSTEAMACGDKFIVVGRGVRFERAYASKYPGNILIVTSDKQARKELQSLLKKAGHNTRAVADEKQLEEGLRKGMYDVALVSMPHLLLVESRIRSLSSPPFVLPFLFESGKEAVPPKEYSCILKSENKSHEVLRTVDEIMESRLKAKSLNCEKILK